MTDNHESNELWDFGLNSVDQGCLPERAQRSGRAPGICLAESTRDHWRRIDGFLKCSRTGSARGLAAEAETDDFGQM